MAPCTTVECRELSQEYIIQLQDIVMHLEANRLVCDHAKAHIMQQTAHLMAVYSASLISGNLKSKDLKRLNKYSLALMPRKDADAYAAWKKFNGR